MSVNPVRELEGTALDVPVTSDRDSAERLCLVRKRRSECSIWRVVWVPARRGSSNGVKRRKSTAAFSLVETIVVMVVLTVAVLGAMGFRYYCTLDARKADLQVTAGRLGLLLLEGWKGSGGGADYDPVAEFGSNLTISSTGTMPYSFSDDDSSFNIIGIYEIVASGVNYYARLSYKDEVADQLRILSVLVVWHREDSGGVTGVGQVVRLTTYVSY